MDLAESKFMVLLVTEGMYGVLPPEGVLAVPCPAEAKRAMAVV